MDETHRALRGTGHARGTLHRDQRHGDETRHNRTSRRPTARHVARDGHSLDTVLARARQRSRRQERGQAVIFRAPLTVSRSRPYLIQSTAVPRTRAPPPAAAEAQVRGLLSSSCLPPPSSSTLLLTPFDAH